MRKLASTLLLASVLSMPARPQAKTNPFLGRWDFNAAAISDVGANWLGVYEKEGKPEVWFQPVGGHVVPVEDARINGSHMTLVVSPATAKNPATIWELDVAGGKISGVRKRGDQTVSLAGVRAPDLKRPAPAAWTEPEPLFNGRNLDGWEPIGSSANNHWAVKDGLLVNEEHGVNIKTTRRFDDFRLHFEVNCPERANSGFYLRGRYEVQIATGPEGGRGGNAPPNRSMGAVYGRIAPGAEAPRPADGWDIFDITLVGRTVTVIRNGVKTIDAGEIEGITGGALDANEGEPGPFYIQGDHTGGIKFRNITVAVPGS
jgi:hypothetical protein